MADVYVPSGAGTSFGGYVNVAGVIGATAAGQVAVMKAQFQNLLGNIGTGNAAAHPDFNHISGAERAAINREIDAIFAAIAAAPTS